MGHKHQRKSSFTQMLCLRLSTNDGKLGIVENDVDPFSNLHDSEYSEPSSPRIGCMGQIKRNNRVGGFPGHHLRYNASNDSSKYFKLNKFFSSKSLLSTNTATTTTTCTNSNGRKQMIVGYGGRTKLHKENYISINNMDPPLPVHRADTGSGKAVSLWKRRCGGETLKCLQLQQVQIPHHHRHHHQPTSI